MIPPSPPSLTDGFSLDITPLALSDVHDVNCSNAAAVSFYLSVAISVAAVPAAAAVRSTLTTSVSHDRADCAFPLSGFAKIPITSGTCLRCGRADRVFLPSGLAKIFSDNSGAPSRHRPARRDRLYQRAIRSEELVPIIAVGVIEQVAQGDHCQSLRLIHAGTYCRAVDQWLTCAAGPPSSEPMHWHMDSDNAEQHDNYVQRHDGHEQDDENPQNGRDER